MIRRFLTGLDMDRLETLETFYPVPYTPDNGGMELSDSGKWVRLSDVQAIWIAFMMDIGESIIGIGTDLKIDAIEAKKALEGEKDHELF